MKRIALLAVLAVLCAGCVDLLRPKPTKSSGGRMATIAKTATAATSGYIRCETGPPTQPKYDHIPDTYAQAGIHNLPPAPPYGPIVDRGYLTFATTDVPPVAQWTSVTIAITGITGSGTTADWRVEFYTGVDLDTGDLDASWDSGTLAVTVEGGSPIPASISESIPAARWAGMEVDSVFCLKLVDVSKDGAGDPESGIHLWLPPCANATLTIEYLTIQSKITLTSSIRSQVSGTSTLHRTPSGTSSAATEADLASSVDTQADETSSISQTVSAESDAGTVIDRTSSVHTAPTYDAQIATTTDGESSVASEADLASSVTQSTSGTSSVTSTVSEDSDTNLEEVT